MGWRLNCWDAATNQVLAMAGRQKIRDFLDTLFLHEQHLHLAALVWAAAGKNPGLTPEFPKLTRHDGSLKGAWPRIVES